jgi:hypothetical protein
MSASYKRAFEARLGGIWPDRKGAAAQRSPIRFTGAPTPIRAGNCSPVSECRVCCPFLLSASRWAYSACRPRQIFSGLNRAAASCSHNYVATKSRGDKVCFSHDFYEKRGPQSSNAAQGAQTGQQKLVNQILSQRMQDRQVRLGSLALLYKLPLAT